MSCVFCHACGDYVDIHGNFCSVCAGTSGPKMDALLQHEYDVQQQKKEYEKAQKELLREQWEEHMREQEILFRRFSL